MARYISKLIINGNEPIYSQVGSSAEEYSEPLVDSARAFNVRLKDSTGINQGITIGSSASNALYFDIRNPDLPSYAGAVVEFWIKGPDTGNLPCGNAINDSGEVTIEDIEATVTQVADIEESYETYGEQSTPVEIVEEGDIPEEETPEEEPETFPSYEPFNDWTDEGLDPTIDTVTTETVEEDVDDTEYVFGDNPNTSEYEDDTDEEDVPEDEPTGWTKVGIFNVQSAKYNEENNVVSLECYDNMSLLTDIFEPFEMTGSPFHYQAVISEYMKQQYGFEFFSDLDLPTEEVRWVSHTTYRDSVGYIAGLCGGYATCTPDGDITIRGYEDDDIEVHSTDFVGGGLKATTDGETIISSVTCDTLLGAEEDLISSGDDSDGIRFENPLMTQEILDKYVYPKVSNLTYIIGKLECQWELALRAGTLIHVYNRADDELRNGYIALLDQVADTTEIEEAINGLGQNFFITNQTINFDNGTTTIDSLGLTTEAQATQTATADYRKLQRVSIASKNAQETANEANEVAQANNQHFWTQEQVEYVPSLDDTVVSGKTYFTKYDDQYVEINPSSLVGDEDPSDLGWYEPLGAGAYITQQLQNDVVDETGTVTEQGFKSNPSGPNSLWNSLGMIFRKGLTNLLSIVTSNTSGNTTGVAIYDGQGNDSSNVVASFTNNGAVVGKTEEGHIEISDNDFVMKDSKGGDSFKVTQDEDSASSETYTENMEMMESGDAFMSGDPRELKGMTTSKALVNDYKSGITFGFTLKVYYGEHKNYSIKYTLLSTETVTLSSVGAFSHRCYVDGDSTSSFLWTYSGETSFDATNNVATFSITDYSLDPRDGWNVWWNWDAIKIELTPFFSYQTSLLMPVVTIGRYADTTTYPDTVFAIGKSKLTPGESTTNVFRVARDGETNIQGRLACHIDFTDNAGTSTYKTTNKSDSSLVTIAHGAYGTVTTSTHTLSGYYPLAVVGYYFTGGHATWLNVYQMNLTNVTKGSCKVQIGVRDLASTGNASATVETTVLWAKAS